LTRCFHIHSLSVGCLSRCFGIQQLLPYAPLPLGRELPQQCLEKIGTNVIGDDALNALFIGGGADGQAAAQGDANDGDIPQPEEIEHGLNRLFPLIGHGNVAILQSCPLPWAIKEDDIKAGFFHGQDGLKHLLYIAVKAAEHHKSTFGPFRRKTVGGQGTIFILRMVVPLGMSHRCVL